MVVEHKTSTKIKKLLLLEGANNFIIDLDLSSDEAIVGMILNVINFGFRTSSRTDEQSTYVIYLITAKKKTKKAKKKKDECKLEKRARARSSDVTSLCSYISIDSMLPVSSNFIKKPIRDDDQIQKWLVKIPLSTRRLVFFFSNFPSLNLQSKEAGDSENITWV